MTDFNGRSVVITGASGGLGITVCRRFLDAGATVFGVARSWREAPPDPNFTGIAADLGSPAGASNAIADVLARTGRIHALLHLMGGFAGGARLDQTTDETWQQMLDINLTPAFRVFRAVLPHFRQQRYGRLIAVGARAGVLPAAALAAYSVSKAGLNALVQAAAAENRDAGITVNAVLPSIIDTPANRAAMPDADPSRWVSPESLAGLLLWLASDHAADVSGSLLPIYGRS